MIAQTTPDPDHGNGQPAELALRLEDFFEEVFLPDFLDEASVGTIRSYREALKHWGELTADRPLGKITRADLRDFKQAMKSATSVRGRPFSWQTINKHLRTLGAVLSKAGPAGPRNREALGLRQDVPWVKPCKGFRRLPADPDDATLSAIYRACDVAYYPMALGISPAAWWRALMVTALTVGIRRAALLGLRWSDVSLEPPQIRVEAEIDKCNVERVKPLAAVTVKHLAAIRRPHGPVFPWPHSGKTWYRHWDMIQRTAGLPAEKRITLHNLKAACGTRIGRVGSPWVVQKRLDHASLETSRHYINASQEELEAIEAMPLPAVILQGNGTPGRPVQGKLF